jgi:hypothetical protein
LKCLQRFYHPKREENPARYKNTEWKERLRQQKKFRVNKTHQGVRHQLPRTTTEVADRMVHPMLHHPHIEKQGVDIHRSFNAKVMTIDQAPG